MSTTTQGSARALILIVDDDHDLRLMLRRILEQAGHEVIEAPDGEQAIHLYKATRPDLVVLDVMMPFLDGFEVARRLRALTSLPWAPILFLTGMGSSPRALEWLEVGADGLLAKPYSKAELMARVQSLLRLRQMCQQIAQRAESLERERNELESQNFILHHVLRRYLSRQVADVVLANPTKNLEPGGTCRCVTVLHAEVRGLARWSGQAEPDQLLQILNRIWSRVVPLIFQSHGTFDKYIGNAILAFYGAPIALDDDAPRAVGAALAMQQAFASLRRADPRLSGLGLGIGLFTGPAVVGNVGSDQIIAYTVIGEAPSAAQHLQAMARDGQVLICPTTRAALPQDASLAVRPVLHSEGGRAGYEVIRESERVSPRSLLHKLRALPAS